MNHNLNVIKDNVNKKFRKLMRKKSSSAMFKNMSKLTVPCEPKKIPIQSPISTSMDVTVRTYNNFSDLLVVSVESEGLLTLYEPIGFREDYVNVSTFTVNGKRYELFAVYDGHGGRDPKTGIKKGGWEVAEWCVEHLPAMICNTLEKDKYKNSNSSNAIVEALIESFEKADKVLVNEFNENVGATAIAILRDVKENTLYFANLGDSRAVICKDGKTYYQTVDADWTNPEELKRLGINKDNQSYIIKTKSGEKKKFILNGRHLNGEKWNLATSRSFGDKHFKLDAEKPPVLAIPHVRKIKIDEEMKLVLIASDGIWENLRELYTDHFISKFIQIARNQHPSSSESVNECLKNTCIEFVKWCMIDHLKLDFKNYGDNIALIAIGLLNGDDKDKLRWFKEIQGWKGKYDDNNAYLRGVNDSIPEESQDEDYGSDSSSCKFDFTELNK